MNDEEMLAELALLYNHKDDDSRQFTRWQMIVAMRHGISLADKALTAEVQRLDYSTTHTCWDECPRLACAQRREIEALTAKLARARQEGWNAAIEAVCAEFECDELDVVSIVRALASDAKGEG